MEHPKRKQIRLQEYDYSSKGIYYITICAKDRKRLFSRALWESPEQAVLEMTEFGEIVRRHIIAIPQHYSAARVISYIVMPDHIHLLLELANSEKDDLDGMDQTSVPTMIKAFKRLTNRACGQALWQPRYYDHVIRNEADLIEKIQYIETNPLRYLLKQE